MSTMRRLLIAALLFGCLGCESNIPNYVLTPPTAPSPGPSPSPTPTPPPQNAASLNLIFSVGPTSPVAGTSAAFNAIVNPNPTAPTTYSWTFGDGATRTTDSGTTFYTYARAGVFDASVNVSDGQGRTVSGTTHVTVQTPPPPPAPDPPPLPTPPPSLAITLTCTPVAHGSPTSCNVTAAYGNATLPGSSVTKVDWDWGDGGTSTTLAPAAPATSHPYALAGSYSVFATVTATTVDGAKTTTTSKAIVIP